MTINKYIIFSLLLASYCFVSSIHALDNTGPNETPIQSDAAGISANALIEIAKLIAEERVETAKIKAEAEVRAAENFGLEAARRWAPVFTVAISLYAAMQIHAFLNRR